MTQKGEGADLDPYEVLGVSRDADEETIKKAYRTLVKKYHPDRYVNTPMADVASEKMKQINEAYDMITNKKNTAQNSGSYGSYGGYNPFGGAYGAYGTNDGYDYTKVSFDTVRRLISSRRFEEAEAMLKQLPFDAEWYYLMGVIYINKGWYNKGKEYINKAVSMDPQNVEYRSAQRSFDNSGTDYKRVVFTTGTPVCSVCASLCLSWLCCNNGCFCCC